MKKLTALLLAVGMVAGIAAAQEVLSRNAVGYVKVEVPADNGLILVSTPFESLDGDPQLFVEIIGDQLPNDSAALAWDVMDQIWTLGTKSAKGWSGGFGTREISRGEGFFIRQPGTEPLELVVMGEVPDDEEFPLTAAGGSALTLRSFAYPAEILWTDTALAAAMSLDDQVLFWDGDWTIATLGSKGWSGGAATRSLKPGEAFFVRSASPLDVDLVKPYTWP